MEPDNYQQYQLNKYGNILNQPTILPSGEVFESGIEELNRMAEWTEMMAERQLHEYEYQHTNQ